MHYLYLDSYDSSFKDYPVQLYLVFPNLNFKYWSLSIAKVI